MKNVPIREDIEDFLIQHFYGKIKYDGIWKVEGKGQYVKFLSKIGETPLKVKINNDLEERLEEILTCAKAYKRLTEEDKLYPEGTQAVVCKDDEDYLTLMMIVPELSSDSSVYDFEKEMIGKLKNLEEKYGLAPYTFGDLMLGCNWGLDEKGDCYVYDIHLIKKFSETDDDAYQKVLAVAKKIVEK